MRIRFSATLLCLALTVSPAHAADTQWRAISGDASTRIDATGDLGEDASLRVTTAHNGGAMTVVDAAALRGHEVELSAELDARDGTSAFLWLRADGAERNLAFVNGADAPARTGDGPQNRRLRLYVPLASTSLALGVLNDAAGTTQLRALRLRPLPDQPSNVDASTVLKAMLDAAQAHALSTANVDWPALRSRLLTDARAGQPAGEAYAAFRDIARALGDRHSFATPLASTAEYAAKASPTAPIRSWARDGVGYVSIPGLRGTDATAGARFAHELCGALSALRGQATRGWIVDLRGNGGGNMWPMMSGIAPLLASDRPGSFRYADGRTTPWRVDRTPECAWTSDAPVAVLVGPGTASSGEAVAVAFRGRPRTRFLGAPTAGVSTSNEPFRLPDGGSVWITTSIDVDRTGLAHPDGLQPDEAAPAGDAAIDAALRWLADPR